MILAGLRPIVAGAVDVPLSTGPDWDVPSGGWKNICAVRATLRFLPQGSPGTVTQDSQPHHLLSAVLHRRKKVSG